MLEALTELVRYEPVEEDVFDLEDVPFDTPSEEYGDNSTLAVEQPPAVRPADIGDKE